MSSSNFPLKASCLCENYGSENFKEMRKKYKEIISSLPKREPSHPILNYCQYEGFWYYSDYLESALCMQENFKARPCDIFLCSAPKTGTTWLKALTFSIMTRHDDFTNNPLLNKVPHDCVPYLEIDFVSNPKFVDTELPLLATHLPYTILPKSILESDNNCKIIYICREPKDTFVSWWHFYQNIEAAKMTKVPLVSLDQAFKWFCQGKSGYGPYWDHVLGYWKASVERIFFLKYEDLKEDTLSYVKKLADFMDKPFSKEELERGVPQEIVSRCNFKSLSNLEVNKSGIHRPQTIQQISNNLFFRKGEIGDWKNCLTEEMAKSIDDITHQKFKSSGLTFPSSL